MLLTVLVHEGLDSLLQVDSLLSKSFDPVSVENNEESDHANTEVTVDTIQQLHAENQIQRKENHEDELDEQSANNRGCVSLGESEEEDPRCDCNYGRSEEHANQNLPARYDVVAQDLHAGLLQCVFSLLLCKPHEIQSDG